jgi:hypothetical protein
VGRFPIAAKRFALIAAKATSLKKPRPKDGLSFDIRASIDEIERHGRAIVELAAKSASREDTTAAE